MNTKDYAVVKHFVQFKSPGTFVAEMTELPIDRWDVEKAVEMARTIKERHNATPYGFRFITRGRKHGELDSSEIDRSSTYYLGGEVRTLEQVIADNKPDEEILRNNMKFNGMKRIITNRNSWRWTQPLKDDDIVLDFKP